MKRFIVILAGAATSCAEPVLADTLSSAGEMSSAYGMTESFANPIDPSTRDANGQRILGPSPLEGTLTGGLMDQSQSPGSYQVVGNGRFVIVTLNDGRTVTIDTANQSLTSQAQNGDVSADASGDQ